MQFQKAERVRIGTQGSTDGRDHWPYVMSLAMTGSGFRHGQVIGASSRDGGEIAERPVTPGDLTATILMSSWNLLDGPLRVENKRACEKDSREQAFQCPNFYQPIALNVRQCFRRVAAFMDGGEKIQHEIVGLSHGHRPERRALVIEPPEQRKLGFRFG
jgi:uncharacterized protein DUF1501